MIYKKIKLNKLKTSNIKKSIDTLKQDITNWNKNLPILFLELLDVKNDNNVVIDFSFNNISNLTITLSFPDNHYNSECFFSFSLNKKNNSFLLKFKNEMSNTSKYSTKNPLELISNQLSISTLADFICRNVTYHILNDLLEKSFSFSNKLHSYNKILEDLNNENIKLNMSVFNLKLDKVFDFVDSSFLEKQCNEIMIKAKRNSYFQSFVYIKKEQEVYTLFKLLRLEVTFQNNRFHFKINDNSMSKTKFFDNIKTQFKCKDQLITSYCDLSSLFPNIELTNNNSIETEKLSQQLDTYITLSNF
jgi:hypothetical protein